MCVRVRAAVSVAAAAESSGWLCAAVPGEHMPLAVTSHLLCVQVRALARGADPSRRTGAAAQPQRLRGGYFAWDIIRITGSSAFSGISGRNVFHRLVVPRCANGGSFSAFCPRQPPRCTHSLLWSPSDHRSMRTLVATAVKLPTCSTQLCVHCQL